MGRLNFLKIYSPLTSLSLGTPQKKEAVKYTASGERDQG